MLSAALVVAGAQVLHPLGVNPQTVGAVLLSVAHTFGQTGLILAVIGVFFSVGGAAIDTCLSAAYNLAQYQRWPWGKRQGVRRAPRWYVTWNVRFLAAYLVISTGINPIEVTEYGVILSAVVLPLTYWALLRAAGDPELMGEHANGALANVLGWIYFVIVCVVAVAGPILLLATNGGGG